MDLFGALVFQIIGQQISVIAATAIFTRLTGQFGGRVPEAGELAAADQEVIRRLTEVRGIGAWTVQGALLIAWQRPDVIRPDDLALRHSIRARYGLDRLPDPAEVADLARRWQPYRSLASSLLLAASAS